MKTAEELGEFKTANKPYVPTMNEALAHVKAKQVRYPYQFNLNEYCDADKVESILELLCETSSTAEIQVCAGALRNLMNNEWMKRAEKYRDSFLGVHRHDE